MPVFSDPTRITNALLPAATLAQVIQLGVDGGQPLRVEVTLMPDTIRSIAWNGGTVEAVVVQFIAYRNRHVIEVAYDYFAQADDGSVWYFGEVVDNYGGGSVTNHSGSWLAGEDGPPGMIMPASPTVGDIYHPENIPGVVFEELIVLETGLTVDGPSGPIPGVIRVEEHLMDGGVEQKLWAPGYGEFRTETTGELVTVAVAAPTDALAGGVPDPIQALHREAQQLANRPVAAGAAAGAAGARDSLRSMRAAWDEVRSQAPPLLVQQMEDALGSLEQAMDAYDEGVVRQASIDVLQATLDLELRYRTPASVDSDRLGTWMLQLVLDLEVGDQAAVVGDASIAGVIFDRVRDSLDVVSGDRLDALLATLTTGSRAEEASLVRGAADDIMQALAAALAG